MVKPSNILTIHYSSFTLNWQPQKVAKTCKTVHGKLLILIFMKIFISYLTLTLIQCRNKAIVRNRKKAGKNEKVICWCYEEFPVL
uniref:Uncharacterized protein n=1 Tax=Romanomermis culicivorax TaxID=13658 RepID=A0A915KZW1_ROMCU